MLRSSRNIESYDSQGHQQPQNLHSQHRHHSIAEIGMDATSPSAWPTGAAKLRDSLPDPNPGRGDQVLQLDDRMRERGKSKMDPEGRSATWRPSVRQTEEQLGQATGGGRWQSEVNKRKGGEYFH